MSKLVYFKNLHYAVNPAVIIEYFIAITAPSRFSGGSVVVTLFRVDKSEAKITRTFNYRELKSGFFSGYCEAVELELETILCGKEKKDHE